jgi:hypothetical protein
VTRDARRLALWLACAALLAGVACATGSRSEPHPGIESLWRAFLEMPPERALALAGDPDRRWVGAAGGGHASQLEAEKSALAACQRRRAARRMQAPCRLYATGSEIVWDPR